MKKIAFIVQRYGQEINGGAELHCMQLAQKLNGIYHVEVITTCALDYLDWANHYPAGETIINKVPVKRFKVSQLRSWETMHTLEKKIRIIKQFVPLRMRIKKFFRNLFSKEKSAVPTEKDYLDWIKAQGPQSPDLINYLQQHHHQYDALIFFTYLYYPTVFGIETAPEKTIFIPTAHDEWAIRMPVFKKMFTIPACIMYNTMAEKKLVNRIFMNESVYSEIAGVGVDVPEVITTNDLKTTMNIGVDYILYVGRIDVNKITQGDFEFFLQYTRETKRQIKLVLVGNIYMDVPVDKHIITLGFVDEATKFALIKQSLFLFQPSRFESLSMVVLEAFMMEKPVLVHQDCEVMKDHVEMSKGGYYYNNYAGFKYALDELINNQALNLEKGKAGKVYVEQYYRWENIVEKFRNVIDNRIGRPAGKINI
jgi:glycosyltransferase involved in cell wall biosynthesis